METAVGAATWLVGKVLDKLSDDLVAAYVASSELGLNSNKIKADLNYTHALLHEAQGRDHNPGLKWWLQQLSEKADEAEDALDELHYFIIQDQLDGTHHAAPDLGGDLHEKVEHGQNAVRHTLGNWLSCFTSCCRTEGDAATAIVTVVNPHNKAKPDSGSGSGHVDKLPFDRVAMSIKIKSVIEEIHSCCVPVSDLLKIPSQSSTTSTITTTPKRHVMGSTVVQDKLYGRTDIFKQTIKDIISATETLSVLPIVGPGGIGKTTFTQHLYIMNNHLEELVENGFLLKEVGYYEYYKMHDLMHELSLIVSSHECVNISSLSFSANNIPQSIRHVSITIEDRYDENFRKEMDKVKSRIKMKNLRTLMIFREYEERITEILKNTFEEIEGLRVLFIVMDSSESLPKNFSKLLHLRYLKIKSPGSRHPEISLPSTLSRFYHLMFLDLLSWYGSCKLPEHFSRLVNLRHFIAKEEIHSNVSEVGKIEHLEELKEFHVKKRSVGFELEELGKLTDLGGVLSVRNLQEVLTKAEANTAKLALKRNLKRLELIWDRKQSCKDTDVVEGLIPHNNLRELAIIDNGAAIGPPSWLFRDVPMKHLEKLTLHGVSWGILPPFGLLPCLKTLGLKSIGGVRVIGPDLGTMHIKKVDLLDMPDLEEWVVGPNCQSFPVLESIACRGCPKLQTLPFWSEYLSGGLSCTQDDDIRYPSLGKFVIDGCCMLSLPPMPHTSTLTVANVRAEDPVTGSTSSFVLQEDGRVLDLSGYSGAFAFHNMGKVERIHFTNGSTIPWTDHGKLTSLRKLYIENVPTMQSMALLSDLTSLTSLSLIDCNNLTMDDGFNPLIILNLKSLCVYNNVKENGSYCRSIAADLLAEMAIYMSKQLWAAGAGGSALLQLRNLTVDSISGVLVSPICSQLSSTLRTLKFTHDRQRVEGLNEEEEKALQLLTSLRTLWFHNCARLTSLPQGLHTLASLEELYVYRCPEIRFMNECTKVSSLEIN